MSLCIVLLQAAADVKVMDRHGALRFIQSSKGCLARDLTAAYPGAPDDLAKLKAEGLIRILPAAEKEQEAVFAAEKPPLISINPDIIKLWHEVEVSQICAVQVGSNQLACELSRKMLIPLVVLS